VEKDEQACAMANAIIPDNFTVFLEAGERSWEAARTAYNYVKSKDKNTLGINEEFLFYALKDVKLQAPIKPKTIMCAGPELENPGDPLMHNYLEFFLKAQDTVIAPNAAIIKDKSVGRINCVPELALVFGKRGRFLDKNSVLDNVFGYTILNDVFSVDRLVVGWEGTMFHVRYGEGASFDTTAPIGPWVVTKDEIVNPENLAMKKFVNDKLVEETNTKDLLRSVTEFASYCSIYFTMQPEILVSTGNPEALKFGVNEEGRPVLKDLRKNPSYLEAGDKVVCEIEGVGRIENPVIE
jgi:2-keto-4-pentenoate hydratase/2-oxohepta-3-ene-1,7-dioic acid hydratase in catechol pathway